ncbi:alpha/beta hydrolase [Prescottella equi]|uniref:alpha/beta hydrolase n=1 Tax=Rhodococcus hoagii TaxID=43767 RepID=UPI0020C6E817|nr:alpha/beta hydrolase [Prescottella equi]
MVTSAYRRGSGEPVLLLHGFTLSHHVWHRVADDLASDYDVLALTMPGHWGGPRLRWRDLGVTGIADGIERHLDEMGWDTCHVVGSSLGGQVAFELARRGRARSVAGINPGGGWKRFSRIEFRVGFGFVAQFPLMALARVLGDRAAASAFFQRPVIANCSHDVSRVDPDDATNVIRAVSHCPVYLPILLAFLRDGPIRELDRIAVPTSLILGNTTPSWRGTPACSVSSTNCPARSRRSCCRVSGTSRCSRTRMSWRERCARISRGHWGGMVPRDVGPRSVRTSGVGITTKTASSQPGCAARRRTSASGRRRGAT